MEVAMFSSWDRMEITCKLDTNSADDLFPRWSPDDQWLAFATHSGNSEIFVVGWIARYDQLHKPSIHG
jgi:Tol biopolymer transport system component